MPRKKTKSSRRPASAPARRAKKFAVPATPREQEIQRRAVRKKVAAERRGRIADYRAYLTAGAKKPPRGTRSITGSAKGAVPLRILAEGDSWFDYPTILGTGGGVIKHLERLSGVRILNMANAGDEVRQMMGLEQRQRLEEQFSDDELRPNIILFSGGGNDIAGDPLCMWLKTKRPGVPADQAIDLTRLRGVLQVVEIGYRDLIALRDRLAPGAVIYTHAYDFPRPSNKGICGYGPWLKPGLDYHRWAAPTDQFTIARAMLMEFDAMLRRIAGSVPNFIHITTQSTLAPDTDWHNEIHPNRRGYEKIARVFNNTIAQRFSASFTPVP